MTSMRSPLTDAGLRDALRARVSTVDDPTMVIDDVLRVVASTSQEQAWGIPWPQLAVRRRFALTLLAAALLLASLIGIAFRAGQTLERDTNDPRRVGPAFPRSGNLPMGTYGAIVNGVSFTFPIPLNGWSSSAVTPGQIEATLWRAYDQLPNEGPGGEAWVRFWSPDNVYADPCAHTPRNPPVGPSSADLAAAMATIPGTVAHDVRDVTVGGLPGKHVEITIAEDAPCPPSEFYLWIDGTEPTAPRRPAAQGSTIRVWIVDVNGGRLVIDSDMFTLKPGDLLHGATHEASGAIDSIANGTVIKPIGPAVLRYVDQALDVCTATDERFGSDPDVVGGFREFAPEFTTLSDAAAHARAAVWISERAVGDLHELVVPAGLDKADVDAEYAFIERSIEALSRVPAAAEAGDSEQVTALLAEAYRLSNQTDHVRIGSSLALLVPSLAGCRLPSSGG